MQFRLYLGCENGSLLSGRSIVAGPSGMGQLSFENVKSYQEGRFTRMATFRRRDDYFHEIRRPLFDPVLVAVHPKYMILTGFELATDTAATYQLQHWILVPPDEPLLTDFP